jgi:hypothetical protein
MSTTTLNRPRATRSRSRRWWLLGAIFTAVIVIAATLLVLTRSGGERVTTAPATSVPSAQPSTVPQVPPPNANPTGTANPSPVVPAFRYLPLWPFDSVADATRWQREALPGGHQPWRLSPDTTALAFTNGYLQFTNVDRAVATTVRGDEAWVAVGYRAESRAEVTAAVIHLAQIGAPPSRPWEVVGSDDTTLTLTTPACGARVTSPVSVGGRITGVDESLRVQVRGSGESGVLGELTGIPPAAKTSRGRHRCPSAEGPPARYAPSSCPPAATPVQAQSALRSPASG